MTRCLLIDCDQEQAADTAAGLRGEGFKVAWAPGLDAATMALRHQLPDAIAIERFPPDENCAAAIRTWRAAGLYAPIVMFVDAASLGAQLDCLGAGIDGVFARPIAYAEVSARLRALVRASLRPGKVQDGTLRVGSVEIDLLAREVRVGGRTVVLTPRQFKLLAEIAAGAGDAVSRKTLLKRVWNMDFDPGTKLIESQIVYLRRALGDAGGANLLQTIRGGGYRLQGDTHATPDRVTS